MLTKNYRLAGILLVVAVLLLIQFIAMQFNPEMQWSLADFVTAGVLLLGAGLLCEFVLRKVKKTRHRVIICAVILAMIFLVWAELAVGIFGTAISGS